MSDMTLAPEEVREATWGWWLLLLIGALSIAAGVIVIAKPSNSLSVLAVVAGIFVLLDGIFEIAYSLRRGNENRGAVAVLGVLSAIIGIMLIRHPINGVTAVALLLGLWLVAVGIIRFVAAFETHERRGWNLVVAAVEVIAGIVIVANPHIGFATLALIAGIAFIVNGMGMFVLGWAMHTLRREATPPALQARPT
jgi:uncharacterized membrane protein HdeD (DUF308 family)